MPTTILCSGYTAYGELKVPGKTWRKRSVTNFDVSFSKNLLVSKGAMQYGTTVHGVSRYDGAYLQDVPLIKCSLSIEMSRSLLVDIADAITSGRNQAWGVRLHDHSTSINWEFGECYLQSFSFNVSTGSILVGSIDLLVAESSVGYSWNTKEIVARGETSPAIKNGTDASDGLVPYYAWTIYVPGSIYPLSGVVDFSFSFQQQVTPRYECSGSSSSRAQFPSKVTFGVPACTFTCSRIPASSGSISFSGDATGTQMNTAGKLGASTIQLNIGDMRILRMDGAVLETATPSIEGFQPVQYSYRILGAIER